MNAFDHGLTDQVLAAVQPRTHAEVPEGSRLVVHAAISRVAALYERIRNAVDYKDQHLLRKSAIRRILSRQLILEADPSVVASHLLHELISARYLPNGELPESLTDTVASCVAKYLAVQRCHAGSETHQAWLLGMVCVEIEDIVAEASQEKALVTFLYERLAGKITVQGMRIDDSDLLLQTYIACYRNLTKADEAMIGFKLLRAYMPEWLRPDEWIQQPRPVAERLIGVERRIRKTLRHPLAFKMQKAVKPWAVALLMLRDALLDKPEVSEALLQKPESLEAVVVRVVESKYQSVKGRLRRGAFHATLYLLITKMLIALLVEAPLENLWYGAINMTALAINLSLPPVLLLVISLFIHTPGKDNTQRIKSNVSALLTRDGMPTREIRLPRKQRGFARVLFSFVYMLMFFITFGAIGVLLNMLSFTPLSASIFFFFLCVVSFFAFRLRLTAHEYVVIEPRERFTTVVVDVISYPILRAGQWLSRTVSRLNVFLFILDFLVEAPFKIFLIVLEEWFAFMREKKEDLN